MNDEGLSLRYILDWYNWAGVDETVGDVPLSLNPKKTQDVLKRALPKVELSAQKVVADNVDVRNYKIEEQMFEYGLLQDAGKVTAEIAKLHAETEFEKYLIVQDRLYKSDYDLFLEEFENKLEANKHGKEY